MSTTTQITEKLGSEEQYNLRVQGEFGVALAIFKRTVSPLPERSDEQEESEYKKFLKQKYIKHLNFLTGKLGSRVAEIVSESTEDFVEESIEELDKRFLEAWNSEFKSISSPQQVVDRTEVEKNIVIEHKKKNHDFEKDWEEVKQIKKEYKEGKNKRFLSSKYDIPRDQVTKIINY